MFEEVSKYFQEGLQTINKQQPSCILGQNSEDILRQKGFISHLKKGIKIFCLIQNNTYYKKNYEEYKNKNNNYLNIIYNQQGNSPYLQFLRAIIANQNDIKKLYCEYNMYLGYLQISRVSKSFYSSDAEQFLKSNIAPRLQNLDLRNILETKYKSLQLFQDLEYKVNYENFIRQVVVENQDLHFFLQYFNDILDKMTDGDFHCNSAYLYKDICFLELDAFINVCAIGIGYFYHKLRFDKIYTKNHLPRLTFLNLDMYDHGCVNFNSFGENQKNLQYISLFSDNIISPKSSTQMETEENQTSDKNEFQFENNENQNPNCVQNGKIRIACNGFNEDCKSILDTFELIQEKEQKYKEQFQKNSLFLPLESHMLDSKVQLDTRNIKISSGKIRMVFQDIIYPLIRNFQPEIIIISYSLSLNKQSHSNNISLNSEIFSEIIAQMQTYSNSKIIFVPHILKDLNSDTMQVNTMEMQTQKLTKMNISNQNIKLSFDESYYEYVYNNFAFKSTQQVDNLFPYLQQIFGAFMQSQIYQENFNNKIDLTKNDPIKTLTKLQFNERIAKYIEYLAYNLNYNLKQFVTSKAYNHYNMLINLIALQQQKKKFKQKNKQDILQKIEAIDEQKKKIIFNDYHQSNQNLIEAYTQLLKKTQQERQTILIGGHYECLDSLIFSYQKYLQFIKQNPYLYDSIHIIFTNYRDEPKEIHAKKCSFQVEGSLICLTDQSQYYVDYNQQYVYIFNIISEQMTFKHYRFSFKNGYPQNGILNDYIELPSFEKKFLLQKFVVCTYQNYLFIVYGIISKQEFNTLEQIFLLQSEYEYNISDKIYILNFESKDFQWRQLNLQKATKEQCPPKFQGSENIGRLYSASIIIDISSKKKEPVLFIFGGIFMHSVETKNDYKAEKDQDYLQPQQNTMNYQFSQQQNLNQFKEDNLTQHFCNSIMRIAPIQNQIAKGKTDLGNVPWCVSIMEKEAVQIRIRPLCNSIALEVKKNKQILLIGGTHNKYLVPIQNPDIFAYMLTMSKESSNANQKQKASSKQKENKSKSKNQNPFEPGWDITQVQPEQFSTLTNAALSTQNRNIYQEIQDSSLANKKQGNTTFFIALNQDRFQNEKLYMKQKITEIDGVFSITINQQSLQQNNTIESQNNKSINNAMSESGFDQKQTKPIQFKIQIQNLKFFQQPQQVVNKQQLKENQMEIEEIPKWKQNQISEVSQNYQSALPPTQANSLYNLPPTQANSQNYQSSNINEQSANQINNNINQLQPYKIEIKQAILSNPVIGQNQQQIPTNLNHSQNQFYHTSFLSQAPHQMKIEQAQGDNQKQENQRQQNQQQIFQRYHKIYPGSNIGIIHVAILHYNIKNKQKPIKVEGCSIENYSKYMNFQNFKIKESHQKFSQNYELKILESSKLIPQLNQINSNLQKEFNQNIDKQKNVSNQPQIFHANQQNSVNQQVTAPGGLQLNNQAQRYQEYLFAAIVPNQNYYQNYLYLNRVSNNEILKQQDWIKIEIKVNIKFFQSTQDKEYFTPLPESIRSINISKCGNIFFILYKEKTSSFHILCCKKPNDLVISKCMKFDKYTKFRNKSELYLNIKEQLSDPNFEKLSKPVQDERKRELQISIEDYISEFDQEFETHNITILVDDLFIYFLSPKICEMMGRSQKSDYLSGKQDLYQNPQRKESYHVYLSYKSTQKDLEVIPQDVSCFSRYGSENIKAMQSTTHIVMIIDNIEKQIEMGEITYVLNYKILEKQNKNKSANLEDTDKVYKYKFRCNISLESISTIHHIINKNKDDQFEPLITLIQQESKLTDLYLAISFTLPNFSFLDKDQENINEIYIDSSQMLPYTSKCLFMQIQHPTQNTFFVYDPIQKQHWNFLGDNSQESLINKSILQ